MAVQFRSTTVAGDKGNETCRTGKGVLVGVTEGNCRGLSIAALVVSVFILAGCGNGQAPPTFDLSSPQVASKARGSAHGQLVVVEPSALSVLNTDRIVVRNRGEIAYLSKAHWSDRLPRLVQSRLVEGFENGSRVRAVGTPSDKLAAAGAKPAGGRFRERQPRARRRYAE